MNQKCQLGQVLELTSATALGAGAKRRLRWADVFSKSWATATLAIPEDAVVRGAHVRFDAVLVNFLTRLANITDEINNTKFLFPPGRRGKFHLPEILNVIIERSTIRIAAGVHADLAHHADLRFSIAFRPAENELLFGR